MSGDMQSLNLADLDMEALEQRLELGHLLVPDATCGTLCSVNTCHDYSGTDNPCTGNACSDNIGYD